MIPEVLKEKIDAAKRHLETREAALPTIQPGEVVIAVAPDQTRRRIVVVTRLDDAGVCRIQLLTNEVEMATDLDMAIGPNDSGFQTPLLAQPELFGPIFKGQLVELIGRIDGELTQSLDEALRTDGESIPGDRTGLPLGGSDDPRRGFKEDELDDLDALVSECRAWLMGSPAQRQTLDPRALFPPPKGCSLAEMFDAFEELQETLRAAESGNIVLPDLVALLDDAAFAEIARWEPLGFRFWDWWQRSRDVVGTATAPVALDHLVDKVVQLVDSGEVHTLDLLSRRSRAGEVVEHEYTAIRVVAVAA